MKTVDYIFQQQRRGKLHLYPENMLYELKTRFPTGYPAINGIERECSSFHCAEIR